MMKIHKYEHKDVKKHDEDQLWTVSVLFVGYSAYWQAQLSVFTALMFYSILLS